MRSGGRILLVNASWDRTIVDPDALLARYHTLTGWSEALVEAGADEVTVLQAFSRAATIRQGRVEYIFWADRRDRLAGPLRTADSLVRERPVDLIHVNGLGFPRLLGRLRQWQPSAALVAQDHADGVPRHWWRRHTYRRAFAGIDGVLFTAAAQAVPWRQAGLLAPSALVCEVPEASTTLRPLPRAEAAARAALPGCPAVIWVGRLTPTKDPLTVLDGFARAGLHLPAAHLTMVFADETLLPAVRTWLADRPEMVDRVHLRGRLDTEALRAIYSAADVFVLGSHHEGSGYALLEALACGVVPAVTDIPSFRVLTDGGRVGVLWPPGDASGCAAALVRAAARAGEATRQQIRRYFADHLSWPSVGRRALEAYGAIRQHRHRLRNESRPAPAWLFRP